MICNTQTRLDEFSIILSKRVLVEAEFEVPTIMITMMMMMMITESSEMLYNVDS